MRTLHEDIQGTTTGQIGATSLAPIELYELYIDTTEYYANAEADVTFPTGGQVYTAIPITRSAIGQDIKTGAGEVEITFANIRGPSNAASNYYFSSLIENGVEFRGKIIKIKKVLLDYLGNVNYSVPLFEGIMDSPKLSQDYFKIIAKPKISALNKSCPRRKYRPTCHWVFGDSNCDPLSLGIKTSYSAVMTQEYTNTYYRLRLTGYNPTETAENVFKSGFLKITNQYKADGTTLNPNYNKSRPIKISYSYKNESYVDIYLYLPFSSPVDIDNDTVEISTGCDKTETNCRSHNNNLNFGGFLFSVSNWIGKNLVIRY